MITDVWTYPFPLNASDKAKLISELRVIAPLNEQAKLNLTGNARDLWITGIRDIRSQSEELKMVLDKAGVKEGCGTGCHRRDCHQIHQRSCAWLETESTTKTGPSGIGKENYTWYNHNVRLVPLTWEDEVMLLKRELTRAWSSLKLEEHRNRKLPELTDADSPEAYELLAERSIQSLMNFLKEEDIVTAKDYFEPALRAHKGEFVPNDKRHFFWITAHYDPRPLYFHFYHWFELAQMDIEPHKNEIKARSVTVQYMGHTE